MSEVYSILIVMIVRTFHRHSHLSSSIDLDHFPCNGEAGAGYLGKKRFCGQEKGGAPLDRRLVGISYPVRGPGTLEVSVGGQKVLQEGRIYITRKWKVLRVRLGSTLSCCGPRRSRNTTEGSGHSYFLF